MVFEFVPSAQFDPVQGMEGLGFEQTWIYAIKG